jgi:hypothetical protein
MDNSPKEIQAVKDAADESSRVRTTTIEMHNPEVAAKYPMMENAVWTRCKQFQGCKISICATERKEGGWLEWIIEIDNGSSRPLVMGAIQRHEHAEFEFHT